MKATGNMRRRGFTLMELLVVIAILALLAAIAVPKLLDVIDRARSATQAYSTADVDRQVNIYYALNHKYPEGWDSLLASAGSSGTEPTTPYSKLASVLTATDGWITGPVTLTSDQIASLNASGISHMFAHDTAATTDVNYSGTERHHLGTGTGHDGSANLSHAMVINTATTSKGYSLLLNDFGLAANQDASATPTRVTTHTYVVFGLGFKSSLVQNQIEESPILENSVSSASYSRALCVFEIPNTGQEKALLVGVMGPDGRAKREAIADYNNANGQQPH